MAWDVPSRKWRGEHAKLEGKCSTELGETSREALEGGCGAVREWTVCRRTLESDVISRKV